MILSLSTLTASFGEAVIFFLHWDLKNEGFSLDDPDINQALTHFAAKIERSQDVMNLLLVEAQLTKALYKIAAKHTQQKNFIRQHDSLDDANDFLNHGNYLAYGLAATTLWVLGIPHGFAVMHGRAILFHWRRLTAFPLHH
jgi:CRISPR-associated protein Cas1